MRGQTYAEIMVVLSISAFALLLSTSIYSSQAADFTAYRNIISARQVAFDLGLAIVNVYDAGNGSALAYTLPMEFNATVVDGHLDVVFNDAAAQYPLPHVTVAPTVLYPGTYVISNDDGVVRLA